VSAAPWGSTTWEGNVAPPSALGTFVQRVHTEGLTVRIELVERFLEAGNTLERHYVVDATEDCRMITLRRVHYLPGLARGYWHTARLFRASKPRALWIAIKHLLRCICTGRG
jgi:hypothetical protein